MLLGSTALTGNVDNVFLLNRTDRYAGSAIRGLNFAIVHLEIELPHQRRKPRHRLKPDGRRRALVPRQRQRLLDELDEHQFRRVEVIGRLHGRGPVFRDQRDAPAATPAKRGDLVGLEPPMHRAAIDPQHLGSLGHTPRLGLHLGTHCGKNVYLTSQRSFVRRFLNNFWPAPGPSTLRRPLLTSSARFSHASNANAIEFT